MSYPLPSLRFGALPEARVPAPARPSVAVERPTWQRPRTSAAVVVGDLLIVVLVLAPAILFMVARG